MWQVPAVQGNWPVMVTSQIHSSLYHYSRALLANTQLPTLSRTHTHSLSLIHTCACNTHSFSLSLCVAFIWGGGGRTSQTKTTSTSDRLLNLFLGYMLILVGKILEITS